ncbi:MAG: DNA repair protein RecN, partial [Clostridia bacterium]|nr:DNA repair protein RecN [Clostridia bacterium]
LSVITGETGAGKSVMIDALSFLLGARPARELLRSGEEMATVSAVFGDLGDDCIAYLAASGFACEDELLLQRTLSADGKVKSRLNGRAVTQTILKELAAYLVSIHGQNDNQHLLRRETQQALLDSATDFGEAMPRYKALFAAWRESERQLADLHKNSAEAARLRDIYAFQIAEIDAAHLRVGEEEELLTRRARLQNAEKINKQTEFTYHILYGSEKASATLILERAAQSMAQLSGAIPEAIALSERLQSLRYEVEDIANTARDFAEDCETDPTKALNRIEGRLDAITKLRRKYGEDIPAILAFREEAAKKLALLENHEESEAALHETIAKQKKELLSLAQLLHEARRRKADEITASVLGELTFLDMPSVKFEVRLTESEELLANGTDRAEFCIATNPGEPLSPLSHIASGGELARIMLALKSVLNAQDGVKTAVFDEVDTGISGKTARKIGIKLAEIGKGCQVLCITHSAQVASLATTHYKIAKRQENDRAFTSVAPLDEKGRVAEVARILGGISITQAQTEAAVEMIEEGRSYR